MQARWFAYLPPYIVPRLLDQRASAATQTTKHGQAVVLFADIAGFTPLSEALGHHDQHGTETLTRWLNRCFAPLIDVIERFGGMISNFGGDAITALFPINQPQRAQRVAARVVRCALEMQHLMQQLGAIEIQATSWRLTLKIGIGAGHVLYTTVGDPSKRCVSVVGGSALLRSAEAENQARSGDVVVDCDSLDCNFFKIEPINQRFSRVLGLEQTVRAQPIRWPEPITPHPPAQFDAYLHPTIAQQVREGRTAFINERRSVTLLFVNFDAPDYDRDPFAAERLNQYFRDVLRIVERYAGYLNKVEVGDKGSSFLVLFGAPVAHENDSDRAAHCALELRALPEFEARIGINTGFVFCGLIGSERRQEYTVIGDTVNLAARLMQQAGQGQILLTEATQATLSSTFLTAPLPAVRVKGRSELVELHELTDLRQTAIRGQEPMYALPMVGRSQELQFVGELLSKIKQGQGQVLGITGEAGMGKSRLVAEIRRIARAQRVAVYSGECLSYGTTISYLLWHNLWRSFFNVDPEWPLDLQMLQLRAQLALIDQDLLDWMPLLASALRLPIPDQSLTKLLDIKSRKMLLESLLVDCLRYRANETPLLLVLEDCHWIDSLSNDLLARITNAIRDVPVLIVLAYRPSAERDQTMWHELRQLEHWTEIELQEFTFDETAELVRLKIKQLLGNRQVPSEQLVGKLTERAQGNPFYIEELINLVVERQPNLSDPKAMAQLDLPDSLHRLIISRMDQLEETTKHTLKVASVIGRLFKANWLWGAYPQLGSAEQVKQQLNTLSRMDLTPLDRAEPELEYLFKHVVTQEVAYQSLPLATRAELHEQVGDYLVETYGVEGAADLLAHHYGMSNNLDKQRNYFRKAGDAAAARYATDVALSYYERCLPLLEPRESLDIFFAMGEIYKQIGRWNEAETIYQRLLSHAQPQNQVAALARVWYEIADVQSSQGLHNVAMQSVQSALQYAKQARDQRAHCDILQRMSWIASFQGQLHEAWQTSGSAVTIARDADDLHSLALALKTHGYMNVLQGQFSSAKALFAEGLALHRQLGQREAEGRMLNVMGEAARHRGDFQQAVALYQQALLIGRELRNPESLIMYLSNLGGALVGLGTYETAIATLNEAFDLARSTTWYGIAETHRFRAEAALGLGYPDEAIRHILQAHHAARERQQSLELCAALRVLGSALSQLNEPILLPATLPTTAQACFEQAMHMAETSGSQAEIAAIHVSLAEDWQRQQQSAKARHAFQQAYAIYGQLGMDAFQQRIAKYI
ncbi:adenylate/guanylate cyclase domain-containing protein [Herpetosiphon llansteffanensis]|uniref:adenylate/guanylate cyclase domain-containing protein n=1 Tax=Herpetosiphon llansteffanensis TaxID=2094568 RepID=UPI000D7C48AD|nr:adenylate/guanylate cyclase domain-containing protein [Herpetosiphon llansteffanensis]